MPLDGRAAADQTEDGAYAISFPTWVEFAPSFEDEGVHSILNLMDTDRWCLLTIAAYTANLAAALIAKNGAVLGVADLEDALSRQAPVCVMPFNEDWLRRDFPTMLIDPCDDASKNADTCYDTQWGKLNAGTCSGLLTDLANWNLDQVNPNYNPGCANEYVGRSFKPAASGFAVKADSAEKCSSLIRDTLDSFILAMKQDGTLDQFYAEQHTYVLDGQTCGVANPKLRNPKP